jgi:hypothetical protein
MSVEALDGMFLPADDLPPHEANKLLPFDPTDVQAELLVYPDSLRWRKKWLPSQETSIRLEPP